MKIFDDDKSLNEKLNKIKKQILYKEELDKITQRRKIYEEKMKRRMMI